MKSKFRGFPALFILATLSAAPSPIFAQSGAASSLTKEQRSTLRTVGRACRADMKSICPDAPRGNGGILACLDAHAEQLSDNCSAVLPQARALLDELNG